MINNDDRDIYPIELIKTGVYLLKTVHSRPIKGIYPYQAIRALLLYTFETLDDGFLPLNREYKPLGLSFWDSWVDYKQFSFLKIPKEMLDFSNLEKRSYLFHDGTFPSDSKAKKKYIEQLTSLFQNKIDFIGPSKYMT